MDVGDYAGILEDGTVLPFVFERKSVGDLFGTLGKNHARFKKELQRAVDSNIKIYFIIEGSFTKVCKGHRYSKMKPYTLLRILGTMWDRYEQHFQPIFCKDRTEMSQIIMWRFFSAAKEYTIKNNAKKRSK